jgi:hypothetical protein
MATTNNKCKNCGCDDSFMPSPAPCPTPIGCPTPQPCSEVFDAQCVVYTGAEIKCDNRNTIVATNDNVAEALQNIVDYFCTEVTVASDIPCGEDLVVEEGTSVTNAIINVIEYFCNNTPPVSCCPTFAADIQPSPGLEFGLRVTLTNGTAPFTYAWSYAQYSSGSASDFRGIIFIGSLTNQDVQLTLDDNFYQGLGGTPSVSKSIYSTHVKVRVTDSVGQIADAYYIATRVNTNA